MWTLIRLLQIWVHTVCKNDFKNHKQMTKQMTIVVTGALRVKLGELTELNLKEAGVGHSSIHFSIRLSCFSCKQNILINI